MTGTERLAAQTIRVWVRLYTHGLDNVHRQRRCLELESDMWEHLNDRDEPATGRALFGRFLRGIPADVWWRYRTLLDSREAQQRKHIMTPTPRTGWWTPTTMVIGITVTTLALLGLGFGDTDSGGLIIALGWLIAGAVLLAGLATIRGRPVIGSWTVIVGGVLFALADPIAVPLSVLVILGGIWTGNLVTTHRRADEIQLGPRPTLMTDRWFIWIITAAALGSLGFIVLLVWPAVTPDSCTEANPCWEDSAAWATWILSWMAALITGAIGVILGALQLFTRHRTQLA